MKLEAILGTHNIEDEIRNLIHLEQNVNKKSPSGFSSKNQVSPRYRPIGNNRFDMPFLDVKSEMSKLFTANPSKDIENIIIQNKDELLFGLHPDTYRKLKFEKQDTSYINTFPTASGRTVLTLLNNTPLFMKLHYIGLLGRVDRAMSEKRVKGAALISSELDNLSRENILSEVFAYLPESINIVTNLQDKEIGVSYREYTPRPYVVDKRYMIPFFSLFAKDKLNVNDDTLLTQIVGNSKDHLGCFINKVIYPLIESFRTIVEDGGMWPENHAQNILLEIDLQGNPCRVIHRDLYEFYPDIQIREALGLSNNDFEKTMNKKEDVEFYYKQKSLLFDFKFGEYVLLPLIKDFCRYYGFSEKEITKEVRDLFNYSTGLLKTRFKPLDKYYYFPPVIETYVDGRPVYLEGDSPRFR